MSSRIPGPRRLVETVNVLDAVGMRMGTFLRRNPVARLMALMYMVCIIILE